MLRLLCFTAHPDDEAGSFGGTLLRYAERGVETHVICLTPGQAATHRGTAKSDDELSATRRLEFQAACKLLKVSRGTVLDYPDGKLDRQDFYAVVARLTRLVRELRPHVVMTMGTEGAITAHPDHSMISVFATMACHWAGRTNRFPDQLENGLHAPSHAEALLRYRSVHHARPSAGFAGAHHNDHRTKASMKLMPRLRLLNCTHRKRRCSAFLKRPSAGAARRKCFTWPTASSRARWKWKRICLREWRNEDRSPLISQINADKRPISPRINAKRANPIPAFDSCSFAKFAAASF